MDTQCASRQESATVESRRAGAVGELRQRGSVLRAVSQSAVGGLPHRVGLELGLLWKKLCDHFLP